MRGFGARGRLDGPQLPSRSPPQLHCLAECRGQRASSPTRPSLDGRFPRQFETPRCPTAQARRRWRGGSECRRRGRSFLEQVGVTVVVGWLSDGESPRTNAGLSIIFSTTTSWCVWSDAQRRSRGVRTLLLSQQLLRQQCQRQIGGRGRGRVCCSTRKARSRLAGSFVGGGDEARAGVRKLYRKYWRAASAAGVCLGMT